MPLAERCNYFDERKRTNALVLYDDDVTNGAAGTTFRFRFVEFRLGVVEQAARVLTDEDEGSPASACVIGDGRPRDPVLFSTMSQVSFR